MMLFIWKVILKSDFMVIMHYTTYTNFFMGRLIDMNFIKYNRKERLQSSYGNLGVLKWKKNEFYVLTMNKKTWPKTMLVKMNLH